MIKKKSISSEVYYITLNQNRMKQKMEVIKNDKLGNWTVISDAIIKKSGISNRTNYELECECGYKRLSRVDDIFNMLNGDYTKGSKLNISCHKCQHKKKREVLVPENYFHNIFVDYKTGAKKRKINFDLEFDHCLKLFTSKCVYCEDLPSNKKILHKTKNSESVYYQGIDRVDNKKGYEIGNVVACCKRCNFAKKDGSLEDFLKWIKRLANTNVQRLDRNIVDSSESKWGNSFNENMINKGI